ncbi:MAG TPA: hypothetical protein DCE27_04280, partial [Xanthomarina gelatinilytica]|nr:hypothetical protein [Xanthomarina gelatinilytica]
PIKFQQQVKKLFPDVDTTNLTMNEAVARFTFIYAMQGKSWAVTHLTDRTEGKAVERTADITEEWKELFEALNQPE